MRAATFRVSPPLKCGRTRPLLRLLCRRISERTARSKLLTKPLSQPMRIKALLFCSLLSLLSLASLADAAQTITNVYIGTSANAGNGDPLRTAMIKLNTNDTFLATTLAGKLDTTNGFSYYDLAGQCRG